MTKVLVVEDNPMNMKLAALLLRNAGHTVLSAVDAEIGLALARAELPDLILMDFQLPGMDGVTATALLKQDPATAAIPVIGLTATVMDADAEGKPVAGCDAYIAKPLRYQDLYAAMDALLPKAEWPAVDRRDHAAAIPQAAAKLAVDIGVLEGLVGNDPLVVLEFLDAFRISAANVAIELRTALAAGQALSAGRQAHKLKSAAHTVGALALAGLCARMETAGKTGNTETLTALMPLFEQELAAVNAFLDSLQSRAIA